MEGQLHVGLCLIMTNNVGNHVLRLQVQRGTSSPPRPNIDYTLYYSVLTHYRHATLTRLSTILHSQGSQLFTDKNRGPCLESDPQLVSCSGYLGVNTQHVATITR